MYTLVLVGSSLPPNDRDSAMWTVGTGASSDFVGTYEASITGWLRSKFDSYIIVGTANGTPRPENTVQTPVPPFNKGLAALELDDTPPLMSVVRKCLT